MDAGRVQPSMQNSVFLGLLFTEFALITVYLLLGFFSPSSGLYKLFDLNSEGNLPAWFSSMQLFTVGLVIVLKSLEIRQRSNNGIYLLVFGLIFIFLSADEAASIHERLNGLFSHIGWMPRFDNNHGIWIYLYTATFVIIILTLYKDFKKIKKIFSKNHLILVGLIVYVSGAIFLEIIGYSYINNLEHGSFEVFHRAEVALEEFLEMFGITLVLRGAVQFREDTDSIASMHYVAGFAKLVQGNVGDSEN